MTKTIVLFRNFVHAPKNLDLYILVHSSDSCNQRTCHCK